MSLSKYERRMEGYALKKWESTLNLCVHAHGHDVDPIMEASYNNSYFPGIICFCIGELILCNRASDHMFFFDPISRASLSTCILWINTPAQPLLWYVIEYYPPGISRLSRNCITSYEFFIKYDILTDSNFFHELWVIKYSKTSITESSPHRD